MIFLSPFPNKSASENFCLTSFTLNKENTKHSPLQLVLVKLLLWRDRQMRGSCLRSTRRKVPAVSEPTLRLATWDLSLTPLSTYTHTHTHPLKWTQMAGTQSRHLEKQPQVYLVAVISFCKQRAFKMPVLFLDLRSLPFGCLPTSFWEMY